MIEQLIRAVRRTVNRWRSSITGRFVTKDYAEANPDTTQKERG